MKDRRCRFCQQVFQPAPYYPQQQVCGNPYARTNAAAIIIGKRSLPIRCTSRCAWRVRGSGARGTRTIGRNIARSTRNRWNEIADSSAYVTQSGGW
jgi:hypothetical protein